VLKRKRTRGGGEKIAMNGWFLLDEKNVGPQGRTNTSLRSGRGESAHKSFPQRDREDFAKRRRSVGRYEFRVSTKKSAPQKRPCQSADNKRDQARGGTQLTSMHSYAVEEGNLVRLYGGGESRFETMRVLGEGWMRELALKR